MAEFNRNLDFIIFAIAVVNLVLFAVAGVINAYWNKKLHLIGISLAVFVIMLLPGFIFIPTGLDRKLFVFFAVALFLFLIIEIQVVSGMKKYFRLKKHGIHTEAEIMGYIDGARGRKLPHIKYTDQNGESHTNTAQFDNNLPFSKRSGIGKKINIYYDENDHDSFVTGADLAGNILCFVFFGIWVIMMGMGYFGGLYEIIKNIK